MVTATDRLAGLSTSVAVKPPCRVVTTAAVTLSGEQTVNGVACVDGDRVLVAVTGGAVTNGIWVVRAGAWERAKDFNGARDVVCGTLVLVGPGATTARLWQLTTANPITIGTTSLTFIQVEPAALTDLQWASLAASVPDDGSAFSVIEVTPYVTMQATGIAFTGDCELAGFDCVAVTGSPTITIYDGVDNTGTLIVPATTLALGRTEFNWKRALVDGCYVELSGTQTVNVLVGAP